MWIKICGVTDLDNALAVARLRPDAIGLNFYPKSSRVISIETAKQIVEMLPNGVEAVGVFVNQSPSSILQICQACGLKTVQLHGDEPAETAVALSPLEIIRVVHVGEQGLAPVAAKLQRYQELGVPLRSCLAEAAVAGKYGGTGQLAPWGVLRSGWQRDWPKLILAGGLTPQNVGEAIAQVRPAGVDVASGVESEPGIKDLAATERFIQTARAAFSGNIQ